MKRVQIEPWTIKEKLCLASAVLRSGDQNWMSVSRVLRVYGEPNRPPDWYSQKQCAVQYNSLLSNVGTPKRKKRSEKGIETVDTPGECIVRKLTQERIEELKRVMAEERMDYLRLKREKEEVDSHKADDRLTEMWQEIEEEIERERQEQASIMRQHEERKKEVDASNRPVLMSSGRTLSEAGTEVDSNDSVDVDVKPSPTPPSPLLTSLLQSPSPSLLHRNSSAPTISSLLHSAPSIPRIHDSPTLSKLLESPTSSSGQINFLQTSPVIKTEALSTHTMSPVPTIEAKEDAVEIKTEVLSPLRTDGDKDSATPEAEDQEEIQEEETLVSSSSSFEKDKPNVARRLDLDLQESPTGDGEKDDRNSLNHTLDSDTLEEQLETEMELDSQTVEMIVMGPNQGAVIAVHHDNSSENVEEMNSTESQSKDLADVEAIMKDEALDDENVPEDTVIELNTDNTSKPVEEALKMISDATIIVSGSEEAIEIETQSRDDEQSISSVVKDLGEVSSNEMKEIIEGAEVIVEEVVAEEVRNNEETKDKQEEVSDVITTEKGDVITEVIKEECKGSPGPEELIEDVELDDSVLEVGGEVSLAELAESVVESTLQDIEVAVSEGSETTSSMGKSNESDKTDITNTDEEVLKEKEQVRIESEEEKEESKTKEMTDKTVSESKAEATIEEKPEDTAALSTDIPSDPPSSATAVDSAAEQQSQAETVDSKAQQRPDTPSTTEEEAEPTPPPATTSATPPVPRRGKKRALSNSDSKPNSPAATPGEEGKEFRSWKKSIMLVYNRLATHKYASLFLRPITNEQARGYHSVIHRPMDLSTIKKNIETGQLRTTVEFQRDMMLMFQNAIMYNNSSTLVYEMAKTMQSECIQHIQLMVEAMGEGVPWRTESESVDKQNKRARGKTDADLTPVRKRLPVSSSEDSKVPQPSKRKKPSSS